MEKPQNKRYGQKFLIVAGLYLITCNLFNDYKPINHQPDPNQLQPPSQLENITSEPNEPNDPNRPIPPDVVSFLIKYSH